MKAWPDTPLPPTTSCGLRGRHLPAPQFASSTLRMLRATSSIFGSAANQNLRSMPGLAAERTSTGRGKFMP
ncbi:hypothetical protein D9M69_536220 [compost metagenome]